MKNIRLRPFLGLNPSQNKKTNKLAVLMVLLLTISALGLWFSYQKYNAISPPMFVDSSPTHGVIFNANHTLYLTDPDEQLVYSASYRRLGISEVTDAKFLFDSIVLTQANGAIKQCDVVLRYCESIGTLPSTDTDIIQRIIPSADKHTFYVVQSNSSIIDKFNADGTYLYRLSISTSDLKYPGGGMSLPDDLLLLSDPKHKQIILLRDLGEGKTSIIYTLSTDNEFAGNYFIKAFSVRLDSGNRLYINLANKAYTAADTIRVDVPALQAYLKKKQPLPSSEKISKGHAALIGDYELKYPVSLSPHREGMLITDEKKFKIVFVDKDKSIRPFGANQIQKILEHARDQQDRYWYFLIAFGILGGIGLIVGLAAASIKAVEVVGITPLASTAVELPPEKIIEPNEKGVIWVEPRPKFLKTIRYIRWGMFASMIIILATSFFLFNDFNESHSATWNHFGLLGLLFLISFASMLLKVEKMTIGTDNKHIFIETVFGKKAFAPIHEVVFTGDRVIIGHQAIQLSNQGFDIFDKDQINHYILPQLKKAQNLSGLDLLDWLIKNNPKLIIAIVFGSIASGALYLMISMDT